MKKIKDLKLASTSGEDFNLKDFKGKKVVLYFYPKDSTPGCTVQGNEFSKLLPKFKALDTVVFGISRDTLKSHDKFKEKQGFKFDLLSDEDEKACQVFDVIKEKNMYGKKVMGIERSTFLFDEKGELVQEWRKVKAEGHAQLVLDAIKALK